MMRPASMAGRVAAGRPTAAEVSPAASPAPGRGTPPEITVQAGGILVIQSPVHWAESASDGAVAAASSLHTGESALSVVAEVFLASWLTKPPTSAHFTPILLRFVAVKTALMAFQFAVLAVDKVLILTWVRSVSAAVVSTSWRKGRTPEQNDHNSPLRAASEL